MPGDTDALTVSRTCGLMTLCSAWHAIYLCSPLLPFTPSSGGVLAIDACLQSLAARSILPHYVPHACASRFMNDGQCADGPILLDSLCGIHFETPGLVSPTIL